MVDLISMVELKKGEEAIISEIKGGSGMQRRLNALGIFEGKTITKVSSQWMRGPVVIHSGNTKVAVGYGMAKRIMVNVSGEKRL